MPTEELDRAAPENIINSGIRIVRRIAAIVLALLVLVGVALLIGSLSWLKDLNAQPRQPPGQIVAIIPMLGCVVGVAIATVGFIGLIVLWRLPRKLAVPATSSTSRLPPRQAAPIDVTDVPPSP